MMMMMVGLLILIVDDGIDDDGDDDDDDAVVDASKVLMFLMMMLMMIIWALIPMNEDGNGGGYDDGAAEKMHKRYYMRKGNTKIDINQNLFSVEYIYCMYLHMCCALTRKNVKSRKILPDVVHGEGCNRTSATKQKVEQDQDPTVVSSLASVN